MKEDKSVIDFIKICYLCKVRKSSIHKIFSSFIAVLILLSTTSFTIKKHFCGDFLIDAAVFTTLQKCSKEPCSGDKKDVSIEKPDCCNDTVDIIEGQDIATSLSFNDLDDNQQLFLLVFTSSYFQVFENFSEKYVPHQYYSPPLLVTDLQICHQVFLI